MQRRVLLIACAMLPIAGTTAVANQDTLPVPEGRPGAPFSDVNLKLAVLSALAEQRIIDLGRPPLLTEHVLGRRFDVDSEGHRPVPEVLDYLARYPLDRQTLEALDTLNLDGGSTIYHHIWHFWHGEDDTFDIASLEGIEACANLRELGVASMISPVDITWLTPLRHLTDLYLGTGVKNVAALRDLPALGSLRILNDDIYAEVTTEDHPTRVLMDELKQSGVKVWIHWVSHEDEPPAFE